jgi:tetratricopeptide (TPR) repeat protein
LRPQLLTSSSASRRIFFQRASFTSLRAYSQAASAPQDFTEEEKEIARQRKAGKSATPTPSIRQRRVEELFHSANGYITEEKWTQAEDKLNTILDLQTGDSIEDETFHGRVLINLAFVEQNIGKREKAERHYEQAISVLKKSLGEDHHEVARGLLNYAEVLAFVSKMEQAEAVSKQAVPIFEKNYGPNSELVGALLSNLGGYLCAQKKLEEAEPVLSRALNVLDSALGRNNEYTSACLANYARLLKDLGRDEQLKELKFKYSSNADTFLTLDALDKDENDPEVQAMMKDFKGLAEFRSFNPEGLIKPDVFHKEELKEFITKWESKHKGQLDPDLIPAVLEELESMPREQLDKLTANAMRELAKSGPNDPSRLDAIADQIDEDALAEADDDEDESSSSSGGGDSDDEHSSDDEDGEYDGEDEDDMDVERLDEGNEDEGDLWRATEEHERQAAKDVEVDMSDVRLTDDAPNKH